MSGEPEIIDVSPRPEPSRSAPGVRHLSLALGLCKGIVLAVAPTALLVWCCAGLVQLAAAGQALAWFPLLLLAPFTLGLLLIAVPITLIFLLSLVFLLTGRAQIAVRFSARANNFRPMKRVYSKTGELPPA